MKRLGGLLFSMVAVTLFAVSPVLAIPSDDVIIANCVGAQSILGQAEKTDAALRINRGRIYGEVLDLFYAMNSRLAANKISAAKLVSITSKYDDELSNFRDNYNKYDDKLTEITGMNCKDKPGDFYSKLESLRKEREGLKNNVDNLKKLQSDYHTEFNAVKDKINEK